MRPTRPYSAAILTTVALTVLSMAFAARADSFTNAKTGEVVKGKVLGTVYKGGEEQYYVRTEKGKRRYLPKVEWTVEKDDTPATPEKPEPTTTTMEQGLRKVIATGAGTTIDAALKSALVTAVEQAVGVLVDAETIVDHNDVIQEKIITATNAFVEKYDTLKLWKEGGIHRCRIVAYVQTRKLRERLEANRIATKKVEGEDIAARIVTEEHARQSAAEVVKACLADLPNKVLTVKATGKPEPVPGKPSLLRIPIEIAVDMRAYRQAMRDIQPKLGKMARLKRSATVKYTRLRPCSNSSHLAEAFHTGASLSAPDLKKVDSSPVFPPPGLMVPSIWYRASHDRAYESEARLLLGLVKAAIESREKLALLLIVSDLEASGSAALTGYAVDEEAVSLLPEGRETKPVVRIRMLNSEGKEIASSETEYRSSRSPVRTNDLILKRSSRRFKPTGWGMVWTLVNVCPGAKCKGSGMWQTPTVSKLSLSGYEPVRLYVQSWRGFAYVDLGGPDQIKQVSSMDLSVRWEP